MPKKDMKSALKNSLAMEENSISDRFRKAELLLADKTDTETNKNAADNTENIPPPAPVRVVRDSFTLPQNDYDLIEILKAKALKLGIQTNKSEIVRAGLQALMQMDEQTYLNRLAEIEKIKTGRPKQN